MKKTQKREKGILGGRVDERNTLESAPVTASGKLQKDSPLTGYQWRAGESGNPKGRPPTSDLKAEVRAFADEADPKIRKTRLRVWLEMADRRARQGSPKHLEMLLSYGWGRPNQAIEVEGNFNYTEALTRAKERLASADETIRRFFASPDAQTELLKAGWIRNPALPASTPTNGHSSPEEAQAAAAQPDDAERLAPAPAQQKITVEL